MSVIVKLPSGNWRAQVRRKGKYISDTFRRQHDAEEWALETERNIDRGLTPPAVPRKAIRTFADIIDLHVTDMHEVGKPIRRSKAAVFEALKASLDTTRIQDLRRLKLIDHGKKRAKQGAGPATLAIDFSFIGTLLTHAAAIHGIEVAPEEVRLARVALSRRGLVGKARKRDRRPTQKELDDLILYFENKPPQGHPNVPNYSLCRGNRHA